MADISDTAIPFQAGARNEQRPGPDSFRRSKKVEHELQEAALADRAPAKRKHLQQSEVQRLASKVLGVGQESGGDQGFVEKLGTLLRSAGLKFPSVTIEYKSLTVEVDALHASAGVPSLSNVVLSRLKDCAGLSKQQTTQLKVLNSVSGKLVPGRITLLLGPPGAGKTVLLKCLAGHLTSSRFVRCSGSIRYNGHTQEEFVIRRTCALVDQYDEHIPSLTVAETLAFARHCQMGPNCGYDLLGDLRKARQQQGGLNARIADLQRKHSLAMAQTSSADAASACPPMENSFTDSSALPDAGKEQASADAGIAAHRLPGQASDVLDFEQLVSDVWGTNVKTEVLMRILGLDGCRDTVVGGPMLRGVSGGQKKRVTSAEHLVGPKRVLFMDEISTGLDSATTYTVISFLARTTRMLHLTTMISLLQPPPEVFKLFDDCLLLTNGQVCFHGPIGEVVPFFGGLGFVCPVRKDPASFLQEVTTPKGQQAFASDDMRQRMGLAGPSKKGCQFDDHSAATGLLVPVEAIAAAYRTGTPWGCAAAEDLQNSPFKREDGHPAALAREKYAHPWPKSVKIVLGRQWTLVLRDKALLRGRIMQVIIMSAIIGSLFSAQGHTLTDARDFFGVSFLSVMFLSMGAMPELAITLSMKGVFFKQRDNNFFQPSAFVLAMVICRLPFILLEAALYCCIVYFWVGFYTGAGYFFLFYAIMVVTMLAMGSIFRFNAATSPDLTVANAVGGLVLLLLVITSGFAIVRQSIRGYYIWIYYLSPFAYALRAVVVNEMTSPSWAAPRNPGVPSSKTIGQASLESFGFFTDRKWIWIGIIFNLGLTAVLTALAALSLNYLGPPKARPTATEDSNTKTKSARLASMLPRRAKPASDPEAGHGHASKALPFEPLTLIFRDLRYFVPAPKSTVQNSTAKGDGGVDAKERAPERLELLKSLTGYAAPGILTALMGGSGAGKTTLLDVIAGRKTIGTIEGDILVNGWPKDQKTWSRAVGYVEQTDIHSPQATVREALQFSARLRLPRSVSQAQLNAFVDEVLDMMELQPLAGSMVGIPKVSGLSVEQRKRLTIAVEVVANPAVIFMDEPTSGLDARAAAIVIRSVKKTSQSGRTVIVTIHQPSVEIFEAFDALVLLQRGGKMIYFGSLGHESSNLIQYLEAVPGVPKITPGENPATWQLEVTGGAAISGQSKAPADVDFAIVYQDSNLCKHNKDMIDKLAVEGRRDHKPLAMSSRYAASCITQVVTLMNKMRTAYWRSPSYNLTRLLMTLLISAFYGTMYWHRGKMPAQGATIANVQNVLGVLYSSMQFQGMFNLMMVLPVVGYERAVLYRERAASMYANFPYSLAVGSTEIPYLLMQTVMFVPVSYFMIGFRRDAAAFFFYCLLFFSNIAMFTWMGQLLVFLTPSQGTAAILGSAMSTIWNLFCGFVVPFPAMPRGWKWLNRLAPTTWVLYALSASQLGHSNQPLIQPSGEITTVSQFLETFFGYRYDFIWYAWLIVVAFIAFFRLGAAAAVKYISFDRR